MWIFTKNGFLSAVIDRQTPGNMLVRFRDPAHGRAFLDDAYPDKAVALPEIRTTPPPADYRWKVSVPASVFVATVARIAADVDYDNFKSAAHRQNPDPYPSTALSRVWGVMHDVQSDITNPRPERKVHAWEGVSERYAPRPATLRPEPQDVDLVPDWSPAEPWTADDANDAELAEREPAEQKRGRKNRPGPEHRMKHRFWEMAPGASRLVPNRGPEQVGTSIRYAVGKLREAGEPGAKFETRTVKGIGLRVRRIA